MCRPMHDQNRHVQLGTTPGQLGFVAGPVGGQFSIAAQVHPEVVIPPGRGELGGGRRTVYGRRPLTGRILAGHTGAPGTRQGAHRQTPAPPHGLAGYLASWLDVSAAGNAAPADQPQAGHQLGYPLAVPRVLVLYRPHEPPEVVLILNSSRNRRTHDGQCPAPV